MIRFGLAGLLLAIAIAPAFAESRVALVIGNGAYKHAPPLANPQNDASAISASLKARGFEVVEAINVSKAGMDGVMKTFVDKLAEADVALLFYAGHGLQVGLQNYLVPVDAKLERERDVEFEAVKLEFILRQMELNRDGKTSIVILDACRDNPLARNLARSMGTRSTSIGRGLATAPAGLGTFIAYATQPGNVALDGNGSNSPFTSALLKHMSSAGRNLPAVFIEVRKDVVATTNGQQVPWDHSALTSDFYFVPDAVKQASAPDRASEMPRPTITSEGVAPPIQKKADQVRALTTTLEENVRIEGRVVSSSRQPNPEACRALCEADVTCKGYQHGRKLPVMGRCDILDRVDARFEDRAWRSGIRSRS
jgi:hypothetical protein